MKKTKFAYILGLAPLLIAGDYAQRTEPVTTTSVPKCKADEFLVVQDATTLVCQTLSGAGAVSSKQCVGQLLTGTISGDTGLSLGCTPKGSDSFSAGDITKITQMDTDLTLLGTKITMLQAAPPGAASVYVGNSAATVTGAISTTSGGVKKVGLIGAAEICANGLNGAGGAYGKGAHMCTVYEMYLSAATRGGGAINKFPMSGDVPKAWVYQAAFNNNLNGGPGVALTGDAQNGLADNCESYTNAAPPNPAAGTVVNWTAQSFTKKQALKFFSGNAATDGACSQSLPIACCK